MKYTEITLGSNDMKIRDMIDNVISHNSRVSVWKNSGEGYSSLVWKGMAWEIPECYLDSNAMIFGTVCDNISDSDYLHFEIKDR